MFHYHDLSAAKYRLEVMNADGSGVTPLGDDRSSNRDPAWSPDGSRIAFACSDESPYLINDLCVINSDGSNYRRLGVTSQHLGLTSRPAWHPTGSEITFARARPVGIVEAHDLLGVNPDGSGLKRYNEDDGKYDDPAWSPDGSSLAFAFGKATAFTQDLYVANATGWTRISTDRKGGTSPTWSPDGTRLAFASPSNAHGQVYLANADGSGIGKLGSECDPGLCKSPAWSRGGALAFQKVTGMDPNGDYHYTILLLGKVK